MRSRRLIVTVLSDVSKLIGNTWHQQGDEGASRRAQQARRSVSPTRSTVHRMKQKRIHAKIRVARQLAFTGRAAAPVRVAVRADDVRGRSVLG